MRFEFGFSYSEEPVCHLPDPNGPEALSVTPTLPTEMASFFLRNCLVIRTITCMTLPVDARLAGSLASSGHSNVWAEHWHEEVATVQRSEGSCCGRSYNCLGLLTESQDGQEASFQAVLAHTAYHLVPEAALDPQALRHDGEARIAQLQQHSVRITIKAFRCGGF